MNRSERLKIIREIIKENKISSQDQLMSVLEERGLNVTQSTVSRDMKHLNIIKVRDSEWKEYYGYGTKYSKDPQIDMKRVRLKFRDNVVLVERANNIIVIKTDPGEAQGVAAAIDGSNFDKILGTVAGDDTIICVIDNEINAEKMVELFANM